MNVNFQIILTIDVIGGVVIKKGAGCEEVAARFCNHTYERIVLGSAIADSNKFYSVLSTVNDADFLSEDNKAVFSLLKILQDRDISVFDLSVVAAYAKDFGVYDIIGGYDYLRALEIIGRDSSNFDLALSGMVDASTKYKLYLMLSAHVDEVDANAGLDSDSQASELIGKVQSSIMSLSVGSKSTVEPTHISEGIDSFIEDLRKNPVNIVGVPTGYPVLDSQIDGQVPGTLLVIAARKKEGKSALLTNIAMNVGIYQNIPVLYVDTEMTFPEWRTRSLASISGVDERKIKHGNYTDDIYEKLLKAAEILKKSRVFHHYLPGYNLDKITALYKKYKIKEGIGLGIFDYIKEPESSSIERQRKEYQVLGDVTTRLKDLAGELNIPFTTAVQLNRDGDIADSDRIARYADVTAFWYQRDEKLLKEFALQGETHGFYGLNIKDTRRGGATIHPGISFQFFRNILKIVEVPKDRQVVPLISTENRREE